MIDKKRLDHEGLLSQFTTGHDEAVQVCKKLQEKYREVVLEKFHETPRGIAALAKVKRQMESGSDKTCGTRKGGSEEDEVGE